MLKTMKCVALTLATVGMIAPQNVLAAGPTKSVQSTSDVRIAGGVLAGRVVNAAGQPTATTVAVFSGQKEIARTQSDASGVYRVQNLRAGVYTVATPASVDSVRLWEGAAPPAATNSLVISEGSVLRGQCCEAGCDGAAGCDGCGGGCGLGGGMLGGSGGAILGVAAVAGVVTAVAIAAGDDDDAPASP